MAPRTPGALTGRPPAAAAPGPGLRSAGPRGADSASPAAAAAAAAAVVEGGVALGPMLLVAGVPVCTEVPSGSCSWDFSHPGCRRWRLLMGAASAGGQGQGIKRDSGEQRYSMGNSCTPSDYVSTRLLASKAAPWQPPRCCCTQCDTCRHCSCMVGRQSILGGGHWCGAAVTGQQLERRLVVPRG
jgi:hypothetical protein